MDNGRTIATRALIQAGVWLGCVLLALLLIRASDVFLTAFAGILFAILFFGVAKWTSGKTGLPQNMALLLCFAATLAVLGAGIWFVAPDVSQQTSELIDRIPRAISQLESQTRQYDWADRLLDQKDQFIGMLPSGASAVRLVTGFFASTFGALGNLIIALAIGIFLCVNPGLYIKGFLKLVPLDKRARAGEVLHETGNTLASWLIAKIAEMVVIGIMTTVGLWLLGIDLALVLGIIAATLSFIPNFGPLIALLPAALIALINGPETVLYVVILYLAIQSIESYGLTPILQKRLVNMPPALLISMQVLFGVIAGALGVILATPLTAAGMVMIRMWYVHDVLGDSQAATD
jgi:predicted PurR-regulated permease PerM